jgi:hypothetical protein
MLKPLPLFQQNDQDLPRTKSSAMLQGCDRGTLSFISHVKDLSIRDWRMATCFASRITIKTNMTISVGSTWPLEDCSMLVVTFINACREGIVRLVEVVE